MDSSSTPYSSAAQSPPPALHQDAPASAPPYSPYSDAWNNMQSHNGGVSPHQQAPVQQHSAPQALPHYQHQDQHVQHQQQVVHRHSGPEEWRKSYCGFCSPFDLCMKAAWCPCFVYGKTRHRLQHNGDMTTYDSVNSSCMIFCASLCLGLNWMPVWLQRAEMRSKYNLEGNGCTDCLSACCCPLCDMVQQEKEAEARAGPVNTGYQAQGEMRYPAQGDVTHPAPTREK